MTNNNAPAEGVSLVYQCKLNLSTRTLDYLAGLLRSRLKAIRSPWRSLPSGKIAVLVLAMLRHDQRPVGPVWDGPKWPEKAGGWRGRTAE
ncbi:hypothetical protein AB0D10_11110 [Kitasatospora sp. NPDC048545]|uniref:hypothetical protein n=1 Tax=Kitasatospora sp. NPDC048545 TaxID=3157208 RepID=UPI0033FFFFA7